VLCLDAIAAGLVSCEEGGGVVPFWLVVYLFGFLLPSLCLF
jgi:hypothetical protein